MAIRYISPTGSGLKDGSSPENAATLTNLSKMITAAGPGGEVLLLADQGTYHPSGQISLTAGGTADAPVTIRGVDSFGNPMAADISGTRQPNWTDGGAQGSELFRLLDGADNLHFSDLAIRNVGNGAFRIGADIDNLTIEHVDADNVYRFIENNVSGAATTATISGLTLRDVDITGYAKGAIHLKYDSHDVLIEDVTADGGVQTSDPYISGVLIEGTAHDIVLRAVDMSNSKATGADNSYWNGDGFTTERGVYNIRFEDTVARGNTDAGYDIKSSNTILVGAVADENNRSFRIWSDSVTLESSTSLNPTHSGGNGGTAHVWLAADADLLIRNFSFSDGDLLQTLFDLSQGQAHLTLVDTVIPESYADLIWLLNGSTIEWVTTNSNTAPAGISVTGGLVDENAAGGTVVAALAAIDADAGDHHVFTLGGPSAGLFDIIGAEIRVRAGAELDFETASRHDLTVTVTDQDGLSHSDVVEIVVRDMVEGGNGTRGDDLIIGTSGNDAMCGGAGDDSYIVNASGDTVTELAEQGIDLVTTSLSKYTLGANVEDLAFAGSGKFTGIGNSLANHLTGGTGNDTLLGGSGHDHIRGGAGNDTLYGENSNDVVEGGAGNDKLYGGSNSDQLIGGDGDDYLSGQPGSDSLNGGAGQDTLLGGTEKDCFVLT